MKHRKRLLFMLLLAIIASVAWGQTAYSYRYWFDYDLSTSSSGTATGEKELSIDISQLDRSQIHALHVQAQNSDKEWTPVRTRYFIRQGAESTMSPTGYYWFDYDMSTKHAVATTNGMNVLDISQLSAGLHAIHYQVQDGNGDVSAVCTRYLIRTVDVSSQTGYYWFDYDTSTKHAVAMTDGVNTLDISSLPVGLHAVHYQVQDASGAVSNVRTRYFYIDKKQLDALTARIWIDEEEATEYPLTGEDILVDIGALSYGTHQLHVLLLDEAGEALEVTTQEFEVEDPNEFEVDATDIASVPNAIYVEPVKGLIGSEQSVDIKMKNAEEATAYAFDLVLPEGVTVAQDESGKYIDALSERHDDHSRIFNYKGSNVYALSALSGNSEVLTGHDGTIRTLKLKISDAMAEGTYSIKIRKAQYSLPDGTLKEMPKTVTALTLENRILGDVSGNGQIDIGDAVSIVNYIVGKPSQNFYDAAADTNKNGQIDIGDAVTIVNLIVGKIDALARPMELDNEEETSIEPE